MSELNIEDVKHCSELVKKNAPDLYLADLLLPEAARGPSSVLHAFHIEITNIALSRPEPIAGEIRFQWWRDILNGERVGEAAAHPVARALKIVIKEHQLQPTSFLAKLDGHVFDLYNDPMVSRTMLEGYLGETRSTLFHNAAQIVAGTKGAYADASGHAGVCVGIVAILETLHIHRQCGQVYVPADLLHSVGLSPEEFLTEPRKSHENAIIGLIDLAQEHFLKAKSAIGELEVVSHPAFRGLALVPIYLTRLQINPTLAFSLHKPISQIRRQWSLWRGLKY